MPHHWRKASFHTSSGSDKKNGLNEEGNPGSGSHPVSHDVRGETKCRHRPQTSFTLRRCEAIGLLMLWDGGPPSLLGFGLRRKEEAAEKNIRKGGLRPKEYEDLFLSMS